MKNLYFDIISGASGDMILSTLIDLGVPVSYLQTELDKLHIPGFSITVEKVYRSAIECSHVLLHWHEHHHDHSDSNHEHAYHHGGEYRNSEQILTIIKKAGYSDRVNDSAANILAKIADAEAAVHGVPVEKVHFHEIGAIDTIVDIAGIALALEYLKIDALYFSGLTDGHGTVHTQHGIMPVPVPAVAKLCEGFALNIIDVPTELLTPTGCAVLTALGKQSSLGITGKIQKTGYGCGDKTFDNFPNIIRAFISESDSNDCTQSNASVWCLESDMDHLSGEIMGDAAQRIFAAGALDVSWAPVFMKKGRPGYRLTVICTSDTRDVIIEVILLHTRTLGVRFHSAGRVCAQRSQSTCIMHNETVTEKQCTFNSLSFSKPEYEALALLTEKTGIPVIALMEEYIRNHTS